MDTPTESPLVEFIRYNNWANAVLIGLCRQLDAEHLAATAPGAYGSIRNTLEHMIKAEADYTARLNREPFQWETPPDLEALAAVAERTAPALLEAVQRIAPTAMVREEEGDLWIEYQAHVLFMQAINHGVEHRTNITTILSSLGVATPEIDNWGYMWTHQELFAVKEGKQ